MVDVYSQPYGGLPGVRRRLQAVLFLGSTALGGYFET